MADMKALRDAFLDELRDTYDAEKQLMKALPKMAKAASNRQLSAAFTAHGRETAGQADRLEQVFRLLDERVRGKHCEGIAGIIEEAKALIEEDFEPATLDAVLIAAGQRAEHYEMAAYGALVAWAGILGMDDARTLLQSTLDEEGAADKKLSALAEGGINEAAGESDREDRNDDGGRTTMGAMLGRLTGRRRNPTQKPRPKAAAKRSGGRRATKSRSAKKRSASGGRQRASR